MMMKSSLSRTVLAGVLAGITLNITMLLTFRSLGFGWNGGGILLDPTIQSPKLIAVWTQIQPLPLVIAGPAPIIIGLILFGVGHAFVYQWLAPAWPSGGKAKTWRMAALIFFLSFLFWEFFTPFNQFGEPIHLIALALIFWAMIAFAGAFVIASVMERRPES
jgi:hypothetical protein